jgi:hypothetical protein
MIIRSLLIAKFNRLIEFMRRLIIALRLNISLESYLPSQQLQLSLQS